jgi:hypothetical protein
MISHIGRAEMVLASAVGSMGVVSLTTDHFAVVGAVGACVSAVVGGIARIKLYHFQNEAAHHALRSEVGHIKELLQVAGAIPTMTPEPMRLEDNAV